MIDARFRPVTAWPGKPTPANQRRPSNVFRAGYGNTLDLLETEIRNLQGKNIVIEAYFALSQIRNDGWPMGRAEPSAPGVIVSFASKHGPLRLPCDCFGSWQHNLRAIALHLENLRHASLYGVGAAGEQYKGWKQIAAPGATASLTVEDAAMVVALAIVPDDEANGVAEAIVSKSGNYRMSYREAAAKLHPDVNSNAALWHTLQEAKAVLDRHHGLAKEQEARG